MKNVIKGAVLAVSLAVAGGAMADDRPEHFKGLAAPDLQTAVANFSEYNKRLEKALSGELTDADLMKIHELTYTLENALEKINDDLEDLADTLEEVHIASETFKRDELKKVAPQYLETSRQIIK
ncbi:MAG: hypothetical protein GX908_08015 [Gammaproteobacteria bacterium]|nr:hypothetical protein [Gammaproteobacteria bacterium]